MKNKNSNSLLDLMYGIKAEPPADAISQLLGLANPVPSPAPVFPAIEKSPFRVAGWSTKFAGSAFVTSYWFADQTAASSGHALSAVHVSGRDTILRCCVFRT